MNHDAFDISSDGILDLIRKGESDIVEFKMRLPAADTISRVFAAFANTDGGILIIGVADDRNIIGLSEDEAISAVSRLHAIASSLLPQSVQIGSVDIQGRLLVYAIIQKVPEHYGPIMSARGEIYKRTGDLIVKQSADSLKGVLRTRVEKYPKKKDEVTAFVAMSFKEEEEPSLIDYYKAMERSVLNSGLPIKLQRVDLIDGDYEISQKIMDEIDKADIVIADFTMNSRNVYFELGYARGTKRRIIQTARKGTQIEFDVRNWRTIFYRNATELEQKLLSEIQAAYSELRSKPN